MTRAKDKGISLLNVLVVVAAGAGLVQVMVSDQESAVDHLSDQADISQAQALAHAGVTSVAVALRRDMQTAPDTDHLSEPWSKALQDAITFDFGQYIVNAEDLRGRFDLNALGPGKIVEQRVFAALLKQLDLPEALASTIADQIAQDGALAAPSDLLVRGISAADYTRLQPFVTALPKRHALNLNTVSQPLLAALLANPIAAETLASRRRAKGFLDRDDFKALGLTVPPMAGFTSDAFSTTVTASVAGARVRLSRQVLRDRDTGKVTISHSE